MVLEASFKKEWTTERRKQAKMYFKKLKLRKLRNYKWVIIKEQENKTFVLK